MKKEIKNIEASVKAQLQNKAKETNRPFSEILRKTDIPDEKPLFADEIYDEKSDRQTLWSAFLKKGDIQHAPKTLSETAKAIERFLIEPIMALNENVTFDKTWKQPRGWE